MKLADVLTVDQCARLLETASEESLPFFAIGLFAGLRSAEIERLEWRHLKWDERLIEVPALSMSSAAWQAEALEPPGNIQ